MNAVVVVRDCSPGRDEIRVSVHICTDTGVDVGADLPFEFAASAVQMRSAIVDRARQALVDLDIDGAVDATIRVLGGPV